MSSSFVAHKNTREASSVVQTTNDSGGTPDDNIENDDHDRHSHRHKDIAGDFQQHHQQHSGWSQSDRDKELLSEDGICYETTYCGSVEVLRPMKDLGFQSRTVLASECIHRIYQALFPPKSPHRTSATSPHLNELQQYVSVVPDLANANTPVTISVNIDRLLMTNRNSAQKMHCFQLSLVSFASKGEDDMSSCVAFVAKDHKQQRLCHVVMAPSVNVAKDLIGTLGHAFDLKFRMVAAQNVPVLPYAPAPHRQPSPPTATESSPVMAANNDNPNEQKPSHHQNTPPRMSNNNNNNNNSSSSSNNNLNNNDDALVTGSASPRPSHDAEPASLSPLRVQHKQGVFGQPWFHGSIDRRAAETRLLRPGDFLIRESSRSPGQFVLSGRTQSSGVKHLLLMDPEGVVRTKDRHFISIAHLVQHHLSSATPIISQETEIFLKHGLDVSCFVDS